MDKDERVIARISNEDNKRLLELVDEFDSDKSKIIRAAINIAYNNKSLIDIKALDINKLEDNEFNPDKDYFASMKFIDTIIKDRILKVDLLISWDWGYISFNSGIEVDIEDNMIVRFHPSSKSEFYLDVTRICNVQIVDLDNDSIDNYYYEDYRSYPKNSFHLIEIM
ncbi:hypothetical protein SAMN05660462_02470 [Proteiniborus ethanoligenes]|uniref:Uncharacterized protein n=1 Tax=Proteiniborus ethanoligenes TaxID=415015 RepID=A0A1H3RN56_9FIRM|nr:hypothetical protein [Proteiniborus ethanoligenes]SDZ27107.1 hypothetical protein SAMN05660462_02470 [Proteiniborus ethanoligenes]